MSYLEKDVNDLLAAMAASVDEETGEIRECDELAFQELTDEEIAPKIERMQKARNYIAGEIYAVDREINRLKARKESLKRDDARLTARILYGLKAVESWGAKLKTALFTFSTRRGSKIIVADDADIPIRFIKIEKTVDKAGLKKFINETGEIFNGVSFEETESLQVK